MPLVIVAIGVILLLLLMIRFKMNGFIALVLVALAVGLMQGMPLDKVIGSIKAGVGGTLGSLALIMGFGAMLGKMLADCGGAQRIATTLIAKFGKKHIQWAVVLTGLYQDRELAKQGLLDALHKYGCLPKRAGHKASLMSMTPTLNRGLQRYIADSNSALLGLQPEDWLDMAEPVNIPGTSYQYKNWRRKLSATLESMFADDGVNKLLKDLDRRRRAAAKKK